MIFIENMISRVIVLPAAVAVLMRRNKDKQFQNLKPELKNGTQAIHNALLRCRRMQKP